VEKDGAFVGTDINVAGICFPVKMSCAAGVRCSRVGKMKSATIKGKWPALKDLYTSLKAF
jgi:hypothetical protein